MNMIDIVIFLILISGMILGFKRGLAKQLVSSIGFILVVYLAFKFKNPVSIFLYEHLPFFKFGGVIKGVTTLNIILYEIIAFLFLLSILTAIFKAIEHFTDIVNTLLKFTIIFIPISKIGGLIIGLIEAYVWVFIILYVLSFPIFNVPDLQGSKYKDKILNETPILSKLADESLSVIDEFASLKEKYEVSSNAEEFNKETLDLFLKYKIISTDSVRTLVKDNKLIINNVEEIITKYE